MSIESSDIQSDQFAIRAQKRQKLIDMGLNPYPTSFPRSMCNGDLVKRFVDLLKGEETTENLAVAGRVYSLRNSGMFMDLHDASGKIQIFCHKKITDSDAYALLPLIDIGDIIGAEGIVRRTERGELTLNASQITMLCKSLRPLPEKYHGLTDTETRYRKRYLDIMVNEESRLKLRKRSEIVSQIRNFMQAEEFLEAETPMLHLVYGGATAEPFTTHHNSLDQDMFLRIAPELYLKRIIISGLTDKVFEINRSFRNEGLSTRHNPEFTLLEAYWSYADYSDAMDLVERLFQKVVKSLHGLTTFEYGEKTLDFTAPFKKISMPRAVKEMTGLDLLKMESDEEARNAATKLGYRVEKDSTWGEILSYLFEQTVE